MKVLQRLAGKITSNTIRVEDVGILLQATGTSLSEVVEAATVRAAGLLSESETDMAIAEKEEVAAHRDYRTVVEKAKTILGERMATVTAMKDVAVRAAGEAKAISAAITAASR